MEGDSSIEEDLELFKEICIETDSDSETEDFISFFGKPLPRPPPEPATEYLEKWIDFEKYIEEKCENRINILDRSRFHNIERPIIIGFNHFRERCYYHTKWLDRFYQLSLIYGNRIEFIVADFMDIDIMYPHSNPISFYCTLVKPENESFYVYTIDERKRMLQYFDAYKTTDSLVELSENLLKGKLYISQPISESQTDHNVRISVHLNFDEMVTNSNKDILLIVGLGGYQPHQEREPDYELIAEELKASNIDIVYIDGDKNYVPFKFNVNCYPTLIFIPYNDKEQFVYFNGSARDTKHVIQFLQDNMGLQGACLRQRQLSALRYKPFTLPENTELHFNDLPRYINEYYPKSFNVLDRKTFDISKGYQCHIILFMDFKGNDLAYYFKTIQIVHQVAEGKHGYGVNYWIADLNDLDVIYPKWYHKYIKDLVYDKCVPQVYAVDRTKRTYKVQDVFKTASSLFYYTYNLIYNNMYYSQLKTAINHCDKVISCIADNFEMFIKKCKSHIFLTMYRSIYSESFKLLKILDEMVAEAHSLNVILIKMDAKFNYVPLEYVHSSYPVHFFIPHHKKDTETIRYKSIAQNKDDILEFIRKSVEQLL